jgi:hypothetical protein
MTAVIKRTTCPKCSATRKNKTEKCCTVFSNGNEFCHHCAWDSSREGRPKVEYKKPSQKLPQGKPDEFRAFLKARGITEEVAARNKISWNGKEILFPYLLGDQIVNIKYRTKDKKFRQEAGAMKIFYGLNDIVGEKDVYVVEGELDKLSCEVAGYENVVSTPDGAPSLEAKTYTTKFKFIDDCEHLFAAAERVIIAVDNDLPGKKLESELVRRFGPERCWLVKWPLDCKDANEVLLKHGMVKLMECLENPRQGPIDGVFTSGDFFDALDSLYEEGLQGGVSTGWLEIDKYYTIRPGEMTIITGIPSHGKALSIYEYIPSENGWLVMGDIKTGDRVFDEKGKLCNVVGVTETMIGRPCYKITFDDGTEVVCDKNHEWLTISEAARRSALQQKAKRNGRDKALPRGTDQRYKRTFPSIVTTGYINKTIKSQGKNNHQVSLCKPIQRKEKNLLIEPYTLGAWLGDGTSANGNITCADIDIIKRINLDGFKTTKNKAPLRFNIVGLKVLLRKYDLINSKQIPTIYMRGSVAQRFELLKGLMDTDGSCSKLDSRCEFVSTNKQLALAVLELVLGLGIKATIIPGKSMLNGKCHGDKYRICFNTEVSVFHLKRKLSRQVHKGDRKTRSHARTIISCQRVSSVPVKCIQVDSPSRLYLATTSFIPTHNSTWLTALMVNLTHQFGWKHSIFSPENQPLQRYMGIIAAMYIGKPFGKGYTERINRDELENAKKWLDEHFYFTQPNDDDLCIDSLLDKARETVKRYGVNAVIIDPWNEIDSKRSTGVSETEHINQSLAKVRRFGRLYNVHMFIVAHPQKLQKDKDDKYPAPTAYEISGSAHWYNKGDGIIAVWRDPKDETKQVVIYVQKVRFREVGKVGEIKLDHDVVTGRYSDTGYFQSHYKGI